MSYRKIDQKLWTSTTFRSMSEDARTLYQYILTSPHNNALCCYRLTDGYGSDDLQWDISRYRAALDELASTHRDNDSPMIVRDPKAELIMAWGQLEKEGFVNPNAVRAGLKALSVLPTSSTIYPSLLAACLRLDSDYRQKGKTFMQPLLEQLRKLLPEQSPEPRAHVQEQEQKNPPQSPPLLLRDPGPACDPAPEDDTSRPAGSRAGKAPMLDLILVQRHHPLHSLAQWFLNQVWGPYPARNGRKVGRAEAWEWTCRKRPGPELRAKIEAKLHNDLASADWQNGVGIKDCHRWLKAGEKNGWRLENAHSVVPGGKPENDPFDGM